MTLGKSFALWDDFDDGDEAKQAEKGAKTEEEVTALLVRKYEKETPLPSPGNLPFRHCRWTMFVLLCACTRTDHVILHRIRRCRAQRSL